LSVLYQVLGLDLTSHTLGLSILVYSSWDLILSRYLVLGFYSSSWCGNLVAHLLHVLLGTDAPAAPHAPLLLYGLLWAVGLLGCLCPYWPMGLGGVGFLRRPLPGGC
jgi:hypothetical protein